MLPSNMIQTRQPRPTISPSPRTLPLWPFSHTDPPIPRISPLPAPPNSTHPSQLDTPVPPQPICYQSNPHAFRHTWGCPSVSTFNFEFFAPHGSFRTGPHQGPHQRHCASLSRPLFSYSYALFCTEQNAISHLFIPLRTLCTKHPGWGAHPSVHQDSSYRPIYGARPARTSQAGIYISKHSKEYTNPNFSEHAKMDLYSG